MKENMQEKLASKKAYLTLAGAMIIALALLFAFSVQTAQAQDGYPVDTPTATLAATATATRTPTVAGTMPPPAVTGTPTMLVPVTGADLTQPGDPASAGIWVALWLLGMLLILYGLRSKLVKR